MHGTRRVSLLSVHGFVADCLHSKRWCSQTECENTGQATNLSAGFGDCMMSSWGYMGVECDSTEDCFCGVGWMVGVGYAPKVWLDRYIEYETLKTTPNLYNNFKVN